MKWRIVTVNALALFALIGLVVCAHLAWGYFMYDDAACGFVHCVKVK